MRPHANIALPATEVYLQGCRATGATALVKLGAPSADELGFAKSLKVTEIGGAHVIVLEQVTCCNQSLRACIPMS